jgi:hypothetical protein
MDGWNRAKADLSLEMDQGYMLDYGMSHVGGRTGRWLLYWISLAGALLDDPGSEVYTIVQKEGSINWMQGPAGSKGWTTLHDGGENLPESC